MDLMLDAIKGLSKAYLEFLQYCHGLCEAIKIMPYCVVVESARSSYDYVIAKPAHLR